MMSKRKFFRTVVNVVVLSEDVPVEFDNLVELHHAISDGSCSGRFMVESQTRVGARRMAALLRSQGSDPEFFQINDKGEDLEQ